MRAFFVSIFGLFLSPGGVLALAALDSSMLFFLPAAVDAAVIIMAARNEEWFWAFPLLATAGSLIGASVTFKLGAMMGDAGLKRILSERKLKRLRDKIGDKGTIALATAAVMPPPFPLTPFVLTCGALGLDRLRFFATIAFMRLLRFGVEATLAVMYGRQVLSWMESDAFAIIITGLMVLAIIGTVISAVQLYRRVR